ncbi:MAG: alpha/beta hydrolase, partial [Flavobacteriales bacterium]|nr:alpha/beta hydrolase [Flavobacteriales bacterium]
SNYVDSETDGLLQKHDLVMVGYRGVDSDVQLSCPEIADAIDNAPGGFVSNAALDAYAVGSKLCVERLASEGVDLAGYSMHQTIDDMEDARKAMGYGKIHLWSNSYGTRVALIYAWMYPESISRAALVTVNPPGGFLWEPDVVDDKVRQYSELCARDAYCSSRTDNLIETMRSVAENMPKSWMGISIDPNIVKMASHLGFFESIETADGPPVNGPAIVDMWLDAAEGDASGMAIVSLMMDAMIVSKPFQSWGHFLAMGASSHGYYDPNRDYRSDLNPDNYIIGSPFSLYLWGMVQNWPTAPEYKQFEEVRPTDVEILLVNGTLDFSTPLRNTVDDLYPHLPNAQLVILEELGHGLSISATQHEARKLMFNSFFETGKADTSLYKYEAPVFEVQNSWSDMAKTFMTFVVAA